MQDAAAPAARSALPGATARSLRIAFVTETWPPEVNGVATTVARFVEGLESRGHAVHLVRPRQPADAAPAGGLAPADRAWRETLVGAWPLPRYPSLRMGAPCAQRLLAAWRAQRPDVVHVATEGPLGWSALFAARRLGLPVTSDFRTHFDAYSAHYGVAWLEGPVRALLRAFHNRCACTMVPTAALADRLAAQGFRRLAVVPRGVDTGRFSPLWRSAALREGWGVGTGTGGVGGPVVGCVGRLAPEKNLGLLLAAFDAVRAAQPAARLVLVGDGPERGALEQSRPDVVFAGLQHGEALAAHYASFDVFAFPSLTETFGNVTTEALASGLPVLAFRHAAAGLLIRSGENGWLAEPDAPGQFASGLVRLAADRSLRERLGAAGRRTALDLGWDSVVGGMERLLLRACAPDSPARDTPVAAAGRAA